MINAAQEIKQDILNILKMVNTVFKSPSKNMKNKIEKFYIANSDDFMICFGSFFSIKSFSGNKKGQNF